MKPEHKGSILSRVIFALSLGILVLYPGRGLARLEEDWVSYSDYRYIASVAVESRSVYAATTAGIIEYDLLSRSFGPPVVSPGPVDFLAYDPFSAELWAALSGTLYRFDPTLETWFPTAGRAGSISSLGFARNAIWLQSSRGCQRADRFADLWNAVPCDSLNMAGISWAGARSGDSLRNPEYAFLSPFSVRDPALRSYEMTCLAREPILANLWVGTWGYGLFRYNLLTREGTRFPFGLAEPNVLALIRDGENLWFGGVRKDPTRLTGITRWNRSRGEWTHFEPLLTDGLESAEVGCIATDRSAVWFGTSRGVSRCAKSGDSFRTFKAGGGLIGDQITALLSLEDTLWIGTDVGLQRMVKSTGKIETVQEPNVHRLQINALSAQDSMLWVCTSRGIFRLNRTRPGGSVLKSDDGSLDSEVKAVVLDSSKVWCLVPRGLVAYDPKQNTFDRYLAPHFFYNRGALTCLADGGSYLWLGSESGAIRFEKKTKRWRTYTTSDGLLDNRVQTILLDGDYVWFGTPKGATRFHWRSPRGIEP